jgi:hypothetical protein
VSVPVENLTDYPALKKLAEALWRQDSKQFGAAIMVGAGFSRCSASHVSGSKKLPLWFDFSNKLACELDASNKDLPKSDPLRLAEEYRAFFGQAALSALIKSEVEDDAWSPGVLHSRLLSLPWSEVLTTNWDTLLERAAINVHSPVYSVVAKQSDLSYARSPRIAKLHGSIGVTEKLIFAQEDYRRYPQEFAAFVNFVRQTFIENELCLIGFSGDDPNFLQWAGWVRDNLAQNSRRIYLVGALRLTASKRKLLESINVAPIDLWEVVKDDDDHDAKHVRATEIFLDALLRLKPKEMHKWGPSALMGQQLSGQDLVRQLNDHERAALVLEGQIDTLRLDRETYPGWIACPSSLHWQVQSQLRDPHPNARNIACMQTEARTRLLYEIAWRHSITFVPVDEWLAIELSKIADPSTACAISKSQQLEVALLLLKRARLNNDQQDFEKWLAVIGSHIQFMPDGAAELAYQKALKALDKFDFSTVEREVEAVQGEDPIWKLRKASLLAEVGNFVSSKREVSETYGELRRRFRHDPNSIWIQSRLAWAHFFFRALNYFSEGSELIESLPEKFRSTRCDPWDYITYIRERISKQQAEFFKGQQKIEPLFEGGSYRDLSKGMSFSNEVPAIFLLEGLTEVVGLPLRWENVNLFSGDVEQLVTTDMQAGAAFFNLTIRAANSDSSTALKRVFSRITLANTSAEVVDDLATRVFSAIAYWRERLKNSPQDQKHHAIEKIRVYVEVLARLSMRLSAERAEAVFRLAMEMGHDKAMHHFWLYEVLDHLISYSLGSIPKTRHSELLLAALDFPLSHEIANHQMADRWPNPIIETPSGRVGSAAFDRAVSRLIDAASVGLRSSTDSLLRLLPLIKHSVLTPEELNKLAFVIWGADSDYKTLPSIELYSHALLTLPAPDRQKSNSAIASHIFQAAAGLSFTRADLSALIGASQLKPTPLLPDVNQAVLLFDRFVAWRPSPRISNSFDFGGQEEDLTSQLGQSLCFCVLPVLPTAEITEYRFQQVMALYTDAHALSVVMALPYFAGVNDHISNQIGAVIRKGMRGHSANEVRWSAQALYQWTRLATAGKAPKPPENLFMQLGNLIESKRNIGLAALLWTAGELLKKNWLPDSEAKILVACLPELFQSVDYRNIDPTSEEAVTASLIRTQCVRLTLELVKKSSVQTLTDLIEIAKADPLPEVRFATHT